jgi:four helix bundle protein
MPDSIVDELINRTFQELADAEKPKQRSRIWKSTNGYIFLIPWANACLLRHLIRMFTSTLPRCEFRLKAQVDDAARSVIANIEEGYARPTTAEYITFLGYSQASLKEVKGDTQRSLQDGFLVSRPGASIGSLGINLSDWHVALKKSVISKPQETKGSYRNLKEPKAFVATNPVNFLNSPLKSFKFLYDPVDNLQSQDLTYEVFIELVNKTDWHLRRLVESLEIKLNNDQKFYQVEQARIKSKLKLR